jgi:thymidylate synthase ThyX
MDYKFVKEGKGSIVARIVADSISEAGNRITTFELEYPRFIHSEIMTHRLFSRNAMSSRAIPVNKMIEQVRDKPAAPIHWGKNKAGMQADEELIDLELEDTKMCWYQAAINACEIAEHMRGEGAHKQIINRLLEPFQMMKTVLTATEFDNFFWLRTDSAAQPEIRELANLMWECLQESEPELLRVGEWHTPYVKHFRASDGDAFLEYHTDNICVSVEEAKQISSSCCAQVSYRNIDNSYDKATNVFEKLGVGSNRIHASAFEHVATPMKTAEVNNCCGFDLDAYDIETGTTHVDMNGYFWSGNLKGWIQYRQLLPNHTCWNFKGE